VHNIMLTMKDINKTAIRATSVLDCYIDVVPSLYLKFNLEDSYKALVIVGTKVTRPRYAPICVGGF
jgi:hypothetical protein